MNSKNYSSLFSFRRFFSDYNDNCKASKMESGTRFVVRTVSTDTFPSKNTVWLACRIRSCEFRIAIPKTDPNVSTDDTVGGNDANLSDPIYRID